MNQIDKNELDALIYRYSSIADAIQLQCNFIQSRFNVKPKYVLLGVESYRTIQSYAVSQRDNSSYTLARTTINAVASLLNAYFDLIPIVDTSLPLKLPKDFIQVVIPEDVYS